MIDAVDFDHERRRRHAGDFFADPLPATDAYVLMEVIHDWPEAECLAITGGRERDATELDELFEGAGLRRGTVHETAGPLRIVEAAIV